MEWVESISGFVSGLNGWVLVGILVGVLTLIGLYSTRLLAWVLVVGLLVAHQDFWVWSGNAERSFWQLPSGFVYHVGLSLVTAVVWWIVTMECWPDDDLDQEPEPNVDDTANDHVGGAA
jgi:hypothetical protein